MTQRRSRSGNRDDKPPPYHWWEHRSKGEDQYQDRLKAGKVPHHKKRHPDSYMRRCRKCRAHSSWELPACSTCNTPFRTLEDVCRDEGIPFTCHSTS